MCPALDIETSFSTLSVFFQSTFAQNHKRTASIVPLHAHQLYIIFTLSLEIVVFRNFVNKFVAVINELYNIYYQLYFFIMITQDIVFHINYKFLNT